MDDGIAANTDSAVIRATFRLYGSIFLVSMVIYAVMRRIYPKLFKIRSWVADLECELAKRDYGWLDLGVLSVHDDDILDQCGLDALCFLRALRVGRKLALVGCFNALWLIPLYYKSNDDAVTEQLSDPFVLISIANVPKGSKLFIATIFSAYIMFFYTFQLIYFEYIWFTSYRHKFLAKPTPSNYAVFVSGIPEQYRSSSGLASYFRSFSSHDAVVEACVAKNIGSLEAKVARRQALAHRLERTVALEQQRGGKIKMHRRLSLRHGRLQKVDSVTAFSNQLELMDAEISVEIERILTASESASASTMPISDRRKASDDESDASDNDSIEADGCGDDNDHLRQRTFSLEQFRGRLFSRDRRDTVGNISDVLDEELQQILASTDSRVDSDKNVNGCQSGGLESIAETTPRRGVCHEDSELGPYATMFQAFIDGDESRPQERPLSQRHIDDREIDDCLGSLQESDEESDDPPSVSVVVFDQKDDAAVETARPAAIRHVSSFYPRAFELPISGGKKAVGAGVRMAGSIRKGSVVASKVASDAVTKTVNTKNISKGIKVAQTLGESVVTSTGTVVPMLSKAIKTAVETRDAGFVVFSKLYHVHSALQMIHHPKAYFMVAQEAPEPHDIFWRNVGVPHHARRVGFILSTFACAVLCIFWSFPTAFISSLAQVDSLKRTLPRLGSWFEDVPQLEFVLAVLAPLLLLMSNELLLPGLLKWFSTWEGHISASKLESSLFMKMGIFMIIQTFFVSLVSGSVTSQITNILDDPASLVKYLSISLPSQSSYFIQYLTTTTFLLQAAEILRLYALGGALARCFFGPRLTESERKKPWLWLYPIETPPSFWHAETFAQVILYFMIFFVYATIAPVTCFFLYGFYHLMELGYRYQFIHNFPRESDSGGRMFKSFIQFTLGSMVIAQLTLIGLLLLKECVYAASALGPLLGITLLFIIFINGTHSHVSEHLPSRDCVVYDTHNAEEGRSTEFVKGVYLQPALRHQPLAVDLGSSRSLHHSEHANTNPNFDVN